MKSQKMGAQLHHIVIVGGGAGGLELAVRLGKKLGKTQKACITLIDASSTHLWKPLLHQIAAGTLDSYAEQREYLAIAKKYHFQFRLGRMEGVSRVDKQLFLSVMKEDNGEELLPAVIVNYDRLIIAVGSQVNDFGTLGAKEYGILLDTPEKAEYFHRRLINTFLRTQNKVTQMGRDGFTVTIVGGGATGVELAAELRMAAGLLSNYGLVDFPAEKTLKIVIVELAPRLLSGLPESISRAVERELQRIHVEVLVDKRVTEISADSIKIEGGTVIPSDITVWAAGIKAPDFLKNLDGLQTNRLNQLIVDRTLQTTNDPAIFAMGDCAACSQGADKPDVPARAQAAHQQARLLSKSLIRQLEGKPLLTYLYKDYGSLISLGDYTTVGNLMGSLFSAPLFIEGTIAKFMYWLLYKQHQVVVNGGVYAWLATWVELINRVKNPKIKLH